MKIGIVTIHNHYNYGALLQAIATQYILIRMGHEVQFIDYYPVETEKINHNNTLAFHPKKLALYILSKCNLKYRLKLKRFDNFRQNFHLTQRFYSLSELYSSPPEFDIYLVGSDQVWNMEHGINTFYFLDFVKNGANKISYASSFGTENIPSDLKPKLKELLKEFKAISVREDDGVKIIKEATERKATQVLDPTILLSVDDWMNYMSKEIVSDNDYILVYGLLNTNNSVQLINEVRSRCKLPVVGIPMGYRVPREFKVDKEINEAGPAEFVSLFKNAKVVLTSSFHGLAFAVNFEKTFFVLPHPTRNSRLSSLLTALCLEKRQLSSFTEIKQLDDSDFYIDYKIHSKRLNELRSESLEFLKQAIED